MAIANIMEVLEGRSRHRLSDLYESVLREDVSTGEFAALLQDGLKTIMFSEFAGYPTTWEQFTNRTTSNKQQEIYVQLGRIGTMPKKEPGEAYREVRPELLPTASIRNYQYGDMLTITEEMLKFDQTNLIQQLAADQGQRAAQTIEEAVYTALLVTGSYDKTTAAGDNDIGNNTGSGGLSPANLVTAITTLSTMKDPRSGRYLGIRPDTLIVTPADEFYVRQLLFSSQIMRVPGTGTPNASDVYGQGTTNPFSGQIKNLVVSPYMASLGTSHAWVLCQSRRLITYQEVEPVQIIQATAKDASNEGYFTSDAFRYRVRCWFGVGIIDSRFGYYSNSTTAPVSS